MRVKTFTADSTAAAMGLVRDELGDAAIIVSTRTERDGTASITAAIDPAIPANEDYEEPEPLVFPGEAEATVRQALTYHGVPPWLSSRLAKTSAEIPAPTVAQSLAVALERHFAFARLDQYWSSKPLLIIGPSASGKTVTAAKLCTRECLAKRPITVISTDTKRAGGIEQLAAFTRILEIELFTAGDADELADAIGRLKAQGKRILIDTPGGNPLEDDDMAALSTLLDAAGGTPVLTLAAGGDPMEAVDIARAYAEIGAEHVIITRMDMARRYGALLAAAEGAGLTMTDMSISAKIADGLIPATPAALARLMLPHTEAPKSPDQTEAAP